MQFIALSRRLPGTTAEQIGAHAADEALVAQALVGEGIVRSIHMCPDRPGSVITMECADMAAAQAALARLPMVRDGLITFDVSRLLPYTGYTALFKDEFKRPAS